MNANVSKYVLLEQTPFLMKKLNRPRMSSICSFVLHILHGKEVKESIHQTLDEDAADI